MITRPLDLLSKLRPMPRNYDFLFLVNGALIALFFSLFGSRFVLSPGQQITLGSSSSAVDDARKTRVSISVNANSQMWGDTGLIPPANLHEYLQKQIQSAPGSILLVLMDKNTPVEVLYNISIEANAVGFSGVQQALQQSAPGTNPTR